MSMSSVTRIPSTSNGRWHHLKTERAVLIAVIGKDDSLKIS